MTETANREGKVFDEKTFQHQLRPAWTPVNIGLMILFFAVGLWPLGLFAIAYMMYGREMGIDLSNWGSAKKSARRYANKGFAWTSNRTGMGSGNAAFDEWRQQEIERLEEERRKLDEAREAFEQHMKDLRMARDRQEFDEFQRAWKNRQSGSEGGGTTV